MTGADALIDLRMRRRVPVSGVLWHLTDDMPASELPTAELAWLRSPLNEPFDRIDLRCLVGLRVTVHGPYTADDAVKAACLSAVKAGAMSVLGFASDTPLLRTDSMVFAEGDFSWLQ